MTNITDDENCHMASGVSNKDTMDLGGLIGDCPPDVYREIEDESALTGSTTISVANPNNEIATDSRLIERFFSCCSDSDGFQEQPVAENEQPFLINDDNNLKTYRLHLATVPGDMANCFTLEESQSTHKKLIDFVADFLKSIKIGCQVLDKISFSHTDKWGIELYGCLLVTCTRRMIHGLAALFGTALRQDAVGVFTDFTYDNDPPHNVFLIMRPDYLCMPTNEAIDVGKFVRTDFPDLMVQRNTFGDQLELHDYCNAYSIIKEDMVKILNKGFLNIVPYEVKKYEEKSFLIEQSDYGQAIENADLKHYEIIIQLCQLHANSYRNN
ncbi:unnamed protein product [Rotaria magnacalcarata]|uniref:Uncharacterized protein n=1 Tax=Rotaria magnacalcarata TaxID=392030 RepID=A0A815B8K2_9BILA|nr:unnamed protein product [Rotaria magnacalcarata]CAF1582282.1 unnamed protein product [Rotaria magnacalcarata]CAF2107099.1 unnamed protein product [Rotaria magnacalcarata]CAF3881786.1 unnamed protein product [Rotaria magnacalcarata]CAF3889127.1 unnamed protein product [Rotaria magnacalcarata]